MTLAARRAGDAIAASAAELARIWRAARAAARPDVFPGLLDGVIEELFARAGEGLASGGDPAHAWTRVGGVVRADPRRPFTSQDEIEAELDLAAEVLSATCSALGAGERADEWLSRALVLARAGARALLVGGAPRGLVVVWALSGLAARRPGARAGGPP